MCSATSPVKSVVPLFRRRLVEDAFSESAARTAATGSMTYHYWLGIWPAACTVAFQWSYCDLREAVCDGSNELENRAAVASKCRAGRSKSNQNVQ